MRSLPQRPLASLVVLLTAAVGAYLGGESLFALLLGMIAGAAAALLGWRDYFFPEPLRAPEPTTKGHENWAQQVMNALGEPMLLLQEGRIRVANPAARELLGEWIEGQDVRLAMRHPATLALLGRAGHPDEGVQQVEIAGLGQDDRRWLVRVAALGEGARLVQITDRSEAAAAERMRVDFVANASHELRTPLATVLGFLETLQDDSAGGDPKLRARFLGLMLGEARRMQQLVEDLMSLSRIEAERFSAPRDPVDLMGLIEEIRIGCAQLLAERDNALVVESPADSARVAGDRTQLLQLLRNLVVNAVKYGKAGAAVTVRFDEDEPNMIRLSVSDEGDGIASEHLPRLTERFYRIDAGRSRSVGGTGLGLAIVKHIVGRHRGRLEIRSVVGEGTEVLVWLPRAEEPLS